MAGELGKEEEGKGLENFLGEFHGLVRFLIVFLPAVVLVSVRIQYDGKDRLKSTNLVFRFLLSGVLDARDPTERQRTQG